MVPKQIYSVSLVLQFRGERRLGKKVSKKDPYRGNNDEKRIRNTTAGPRSSQGSGGRGKRRWWRFTHFLTSLVPK